MRATPGKDNIRLAVFAVTLAVLVLAFGDAVVKSLSVSFPLWQIYVLRSLIAVGILLVFIRLRDPLLSLKPRSVGWTAIRSLLLVSMWVAYYSALPHIQLSIAAAVYYTIPLFITLFSALLTGDRVGPRSWLAIAIGFAGVIVIVRPDTGQVNYYVLLPLVAAVLYAIAMILTRTKCAAESPVVLALSLNVGFIVIGFVATVIITVWDPSELIVNQNSFLFGNWLWPDTMGWLAMAVLGIVIVIGSTFAAIAYQNGPSATVASFDYSYLVFSAMWGLIFFSEVPDLLSVVGMLMITGAGLIAVRQ